ncbi:MULTISPECIES: hypothetical protein [unclassified Rothia (in: high G+C Gram-positive bacteria)]|uniref:hypothetical protein n=1 Tax=unclassified Rothia (in: high G+C Gram-positive bacteria) TaxID=2689056 RepID=UPI0008A53262|nr:MULTISPECIES: hypothetical protein [unclassified Rothia (in: high G+C Gram-positive bacteria)]
MDNLGSQKELEVIHSHFFEILGYIFQKYHSGADSTRHIRAGSSHVFITQLHHAVSTPDSAAQQLGSPVLTPGKAVNQA